MKTIKSIITGLLSGAVFLMTVQITLAQEIVQASTNSGEEKKATEKFSPSFQIPDTYFEFIGDPGEEDDPTKWVESTDASGCPSGETQACKVLIKGSYLLPTSPRTINPLRLPNNRMPVIPTEGDFHIPDPDAVGDNEGQPYASTLEIYNRSVETQSTE